MRVGGGVRVARQILGGSELSIRGGCERGNSALVRRDLERGGVGSPGRGRPQRICL